MKPMRNSGCEGRANAKGLPVLYLATDLDTAMAETRPWVGAHISVAVFETLRMLKLMDCSDPKRYTDLKLDWGDSLSIAEPDPAEREKAVWGEIAYAFSEPVTATDVRADYAPTQILAEQFKAMGL